MERSRSQSSIRVVKGRAGFRAQVIAPNGSRTTKQCRTRQEARDWITLTLARDSSTSAARAVNSESSLGQWVEKWLAARVTKVAPKTYANELSHVRLYLAPLADVPLADLSAGAIEDWLSALEHGGRLARPGRGQPHTVRICHSLISTILRDAVKHRLIASSPMAHVTRPRVPPPAPKHLSLDELRIVLDEVAATGDPRSLAVELMALLGLWRNESLGLTWADVDHVGRHIYVRAQLGRASNAPGAPLVRRELKTLSSRRALAIPASLDEKLRRARERAHRGADEDYVISLGDGRPADPDALTRWLDELGRGVGIKVTPHRLRHTAATLMLNQGVPIESVSKVLGHSEIRTTGIYARVLDRSADAAIDALASIVQLAAPLEPGSNAPLVTSDESM